MVGDTVQVTGFLCETPSLRFLAVTGPDGSFDLDVFGGTWHLHRGRRLLLVIVAKRVGITMISKFQPAFGCLYL